MNNTMSPRTRFESYTLGRLHTTWEHELTTDSKDTSAKSHSSIELLQERCNLPIKKIKWQFQ